MTADPFVDAVDSGPRSDHGDVAHLPLTVTEPAEALADARVDLLALIRDGLPPREFVPGCDPWLIRGKRYLMPAPAGTGKSLAALVIAVQIVRCGGTVIILDVENGADEYAARLSDVLDSDMVAGVSERLHYHAWPRIRTTWAGDEWAAAVAGADLVILDSSRMLLSAAGLDEDSNNDYAQFAEGLLVPLSRVGITTLTLDNTGHGDTDRARGAKAKDDLNEVRYTLKATRPFDRDQAGELELRRGRCRFSGLPERMTMTVGGGTYMPPTVPDEHDAPSEPFRPTALMDRASRAIEQSPGLGRQEILDLIGGRRNYATQALTLLVNEGYVTATTDGRHKRHHSAKPYRDEEATNAA